MKNLEQREGWKNRHIDPLPVEPCMIKIMYKDGGLDYEEIILCRWIPFNKNNYPENDLPPQCYLGTARAHKFGYHAWEQNNSEFVYYYQLCDCGYMAENNICTGCGLKKT